MPLGATDLSRSVAPKALLREHYSSSVPSLIPSNRNVER